MNKALQFLRVAAAVPVVRPGDVDANLASILALVRAAEHESAAAVVFPELCLTGYTCADLFYQPALLNAAEDALTKFLAVTRSANAVYFLGLPVRLNGHLFNCAAVCHAGKLLGVVPKCYLPNTHEFYEARWFASAEDTTDQEVDLAGVTVPFGNNQLFRDTTTGATYGVELCEDMWAVVPPSCSLALRGANILVNLSASNELVGKTEYRRTLVTQQSARCLAAYIYAGAGVGESTTDLVFGGHTLIAEDGTLLAEGPRFDRNAHITFADVDLGFLEFERTQNHAFLQGGSVTPFAESVVLSSRPVPPPRDLYRKLDPHPFVPADDAARSARAAEILAIQETGLATRLAAIACKDVVLGLSGGLDSALALLVCVGAFRRLGLPEKGIHALTLPGFGTTKRTRSNVDRLCEGLGLRPVTVDIAPACRQHLKDLRHAESKRDVVYENAQARERTQILMDYANEVHGIVIGTGDLSELALGWCTYNADHMSMYGVNSGVPKTLVRYLVAHVASTYAAQPTHPDLFATSYKPQAIGQALRDILATPVSPELLPASADGTIAQKTESVVGPYELHDFFLYHFLRRGAPKQKIAYLARLAFRGVYSGAEIDKWLDSFYRRFFSQQFKRSCLPDGPKVGSMNLSPRGDWRMPSDASAAVFNR